MYVKCVFVSCAGNRTSAMMTMLSVDTIVVRGKCLLAYAFRNIAGSIVGGNEMLPKPRHSNVIIPPDSSMRC